jgi:alpha-tubulin suppressor-like RCC1 family protein
VGNSNWVDLAAAFYRPVGFQVVGIQLDGSLWQISQAPFPLRADRPPAIAPQRIGTDSDWKSLASDYGHFLALKQDGSIWGWGLNNYGQLGDGPKQMTNGPVRIGNDSDWLAVFANGLTSAGLKRDGSLWKWGGLIRLPDGTWLKQMTPHPAPIRLSLEGTNIALFRSGFRCDFIVRTDGSVWAVGQISFSRFGNSRSPGIARGPVRLGKGSDWRDVTATSWRIAAIKKDGSLWNDEGFWYGSPVEKRSASKLSAYSDWLAVTTYGAVTSYGSDAVLALAADGTLCCWATSSAYNSSESLLAPTRRPLWSVNILDTAQ